MNILSIQEGRVVGVLKVSNGTPKCLAIDAEMKRLYVGTKEGLLLIFNVQISDL